MYILPKLQNWSVIIVFNVHIKSTIDIIPKLTIYGITFVDSNK